MVRAILPSSVAHIDGIDGVERLVAGNQGLHALEDTRDELAGHSLVLPAGNENVKETE